ncbi:hypothetical protein BP6252_11658 [Coleophoma cylindrospora]|uniref:Uncharacterized protein n=1 Tax=Coleophoma cylindrospora TaxID=1849047 RepID=A0A3D8QK88_9HELO|nr:hypothetical protein BP6252_11658 [Coleophoma cylindrospora]
MACYCANYYGSINCHNQVSKFGDRCALCLSSYSQSTVARAMQNGIPQASEQWMANTQREQLRRDEEKVRRQRISRTTTS